MSKILKGIAILLLVAATAVPAQAGIITTLIGDQSFAPIALDLNNPSNAINVDGMLHVTGFSDGIGALQIIDLTTGVAGPVQQFHSLNGLGGASGVEEVIRLNDGRVLYLGGSQFGANTQTSTYWIDGVTNPISATGNGNTSGRLEGSASNGAIVGFASANAAVGQIGGQFQSLPGNGQFAIDITTDARYIVGDSIWMLGPNGYETLNTSGFALPTNGTLPTQWGGAAIDPVTGEAVLTGSYIDLLTFELNTGFWNPNGTVLGTFAGEFQDFEVWEGQLVAGLNGLDGDGHLLAISDFSSLSIFDITGQTSLLRENGLFVGSAGFLLDGPNGPIVTAYTTNPVNSVPEPSSFLLWLLGTIGLCLKTRCRWLFAR
jgi:hypothetical protein